MDYYQELGVDRSAAPEEIRHAYKRLVRLVHPDRCSDDASRRLADLQMKRLNGVLATLTDASAREEYDQSLPLDVVMLGGAPRPRSRRVPGWLWPMVVCVAVCIGLASLPNRPSRPASARPAPALPEPAAVTRQAPAPKLPVPTARPHPRNRGSTDDVPPVPPAMPPARLEPEPPREAAPSILASESPHRMALPDGIARAPRPPGLAGDWFFISEPHTSSSGLYPPDYIELRVTEASGMVHGKYRARYRIADRAISPTVAFQFEGRAMEDGAQLPWTGAGGAQGEVTLRLLTSGALEVTWEANKLGEQLGLISGTATLVRRLD